MRAIRTARWKPVANFDYAPQQEISGQYTVNTKSYVEIIAAPLHVAGDLDAQQLEDGGHKTGSRAREPLRLLHRGAALRSHPEG